jgi:hypothetical protein
MGLTAQTGQAQDQCLMPNTVQRTTWDGHPVSLGLGFTLRKSKKGRELTAACGLWSHQLGWELRLDVNGLLARSQVCRSRDEVLAICEQWQDAMVSAGWR